MFLEQICPGQVNSHSQAVHTFIYKNDRFIVYATGSNVVIYADPDNLVQIIAASTLFNQHEDTEPVTAVSGNSRTGQIALSCHNHIAILKPSIKEHRWELETILDSTSLIHCLDWSVNNILLSAGKDVSLWAFGENWKLVCSKKPATDIFLAKFEPRSDVFATVGKFDRLVTIWYQDNFDSTDSIEYSFSLISHPKYVTHFAWRNLPDSAEKNDCTLFTMARDGIGRFWSPVNMEKHHMLYMCAVIDSNQSLVTSEPTEESVHASHDIGDTIMGDEKTEEGEKDVFSPIHYIGCDELSNAVHSKFKSHSKHERFDQRVDRIRERVKDTPDLLFRIQGDGSLTLWGVQHLNTFPRRIPRVFVVLRVDKAVDPLEVIYFLNPTHILHDYAHIQSSSTIKPIELSLVARNPHGQLRCYSLNLVDFLDTTSFSPRLHLKYTWLGHQHAISQLYQTQKNRFCTVGIDGQINVWKYELRETCGKMTTQLQLDCSLFIDSKNILSVPVDKDKYLAAYDGDQLKVYEFDNVQDCHLHHSQLCMNSESLDLSFLHVYNMEDPDTGYKSYLLIGVSNSNHSITTWHLKPSSSGHLNIVYRGSKEMTDWEGKEINVVVSASQWATNTASKLFHRMAYQKRLVLTVSLNDSVLFYSVDTTQEEVDWQVIYTIDTSQLEGTVHQIRCSSNVVSMISGEDRRTLSIWMEMRVGVAPSCVKTIQFDEPVSDLAWNVTSDAQYLLAVAFPKSVGIFGQKRARYAVADDWVCYTKFEVDTPQDIKALAWVDCGVLTVAAGNQIRCYLKWLTEEDSLDTHIQQPENAKLEPMSSIFDISYEMNGPLPFYHPDHIIHYIMWGKMDLVHAALISLNRFLRQFVDDDDNVINEFPPVSFPKMLKLQNDSNDKKAKQQYSGLFDDDSDNEILKKDDDEDDEDVVRHLTSDEAKNLAHSLKKKILPGLNESERAHLIAMVDTIVEITNQGDSLDENGARFTALLENHFDLNKLLPVEQRQPDLNSRDFIWALHSQSQDLLLERCIKLCGNKFVWEDARSLGIFLWLQKIDVVKDRMATIARNIYLSKSEYRDPVDCTLYYIALRKKNLLEGLWKTASHHKEQQAMKKFLANDFNDPRWQRAASKNAFALLGKQRFEYAASFFLLADKLKDAVNVILKNMKDYQLAIAICRVYEGDHSHLLKEILENTIIPMAIENNDRWLVSMAFWLLNKQKDAVRSMVVPLTQFIDKDIDTTGKDYAEEVRDPNAFILYNSLKKTLNQNQNMIVPYEIEYRFSLLVSRSYERLGCPLLALYILQKFYMKPPVAAIEDYKKENANNLCDSKADSAPSYATDLFAEEKTKPSCAADLFADDSNDIFASSSKPSYANDLFSDEDIFAPKKSSGGLFDDDDDLFAPKNTKGSLFDDDNDLFADRKIVASDAEIEDEADYTSEREYDGLDGYKALLVIRMLQTFFHAASALYNSLESPDNTHEIRYRSLFLRNRQALLDLGESVKISPYVFSRLLMEKSIETDVFPLYLHILNEGVPKDFDVHQFLRSFKVGCFEVNEVALMPQELEFSTLLFVENWSKHVIKTFSIWNELRHKYCNPETAALTTRQIALTTYISLILIALKERQYELCWPMLYHFKPFLEALGTNGTDAAITSRLSLLLKNETKMHEMSTDDFESFSDGSMFGFDMNEEVYRPLLDSQDKSAGANILEAASLNYVLSAIEYAMQCQGKHGSLGEQLTDFIWTTLLDPIAYRAHCLKQTIKIQLENDLSRHNISKKLRTLRQKKYWRSIKSLSSADRLLTFAQEAPSSVNVLEDDQHHNSFRVVYHSSSTAYAFCLNSSARSSVAVCLKNEIQEIDLSKTTNTGAPLFRTRSASSSGFGQDHHIDSYPDTEEDDSDSSDERGSIHTNATNKQQTRRKLPTTASSRVSGSSSPLVSPAGSRTFDEHVQKVPQPPNLNLEHLHDTLRKSLNKGSDYARTPTNASPSGFDSEKMITLRRNISASCAETHPQYPFYITGCEVNNGGPSAILWQFGQEREIASYYGCQGKTTRIHFDQFGQKFGAGDTSGNLCLWRFDAHAHSNKPYYTINCHSKATRDFTFVNSSSLIATAGTSVAMSRKRDHLTLLDTLLPSSKAMICSLPGHDGGAYAITYEPNSQLLFSGGKRGEIVVSDIRQRTTMHTFTAHQSRIRSISIDPENKALITGSIDGELKIWDVSTYKLRQAFDIQPRNRFLAPTFNRIPLKAFGVTQIHVMDDNSIYTSGPSGIIKCNRVM